MEEGLKISEMGTEYVIECPDKDYDLILTEYKEIPLTEGKVTIVDVGDYEYLNQWRWHSFTRGKTDYVVRGESKNGRYTLLYMHRVIMGCPFGKEVDHRNGNGLDNRQSSNLRISTRSQNASNAVDKGSKSGYKGVYYHRKNRMWVAKVMVNYESIYLGSYPTKEEAAIAYNKAAKKYHGEFVKLNTIKGD